jgi:hypothetical protein
MKTEQQIKNAKKFTDDLMLYLQRATKTLVDKDGNGCQVASIEFDQDSLSPTLIVEFRSFSGEVSSFTCFSDYEH